MKQNKKKLYLVDVSSLFFRSYYAISSHLTSPSGMPTNALYGFLSMTIKFLKENEAEHIVYCLDQEAPTFRTKIYKDYKANREEPPDDLKPQFPYIKKITKVLGIPTAEKKGYEADDLIGSLAVQSQKKYQVTIVSGDKDFAQLVSDNVVLFDPMREKHYDSEAVKAKWGVAPEQMIDYLAIVGDSSDNIPGVFGIGAKGAQNLLAEYGNLENIYKNLDSIKGKTVEKLKQSKKEAFLSQKLARIVTDIDYSKFLPSFQIQPRQIAKLKTLLQDLGFKTFEKKLCPDEKTSSVKSSDSNAKAVKNNKRLSSNLKVNHFKWSELSQLIQCYEKIWVFSVEEKYFMSRKNKVISLEEHNLKKVGKLFSEKRIVWRGHGLKKIWKDFHCTHPLTDWDSLIAVYLIESVPPNRVESIFTRYLQKDFSLLSLSPGEIYHAYKKLREQLIVKMEELNLLDFYQNVEVVLVPILFEMEQTGILLDTAELKKQTKDITQQISLIEKDIFSQVGYEFNMASPKQLADVLFIKLGLEPIRKTKTGYSTDVDVLTRLKTKHRVIPLILEHRELFKLKTTYVDALPLLVKKETGRVHTHFRQAFTVTGRLSSINPNLQNIPIKTKRGKKVRKAFIAKPGCQLISADYSQIELRILAHLTEDKALCSAFENNVDIHKATASEMYQISVKKVDEDLRRKAKAINFGLMYGQGPYTLSEALGVSVGEAKEIIDNYFKRFKRVKEYIEDVIKKASKTGYVETMFGRRRQIAEIKSSRFQSKKFGERVAVNTPIQGTASDVVKMAMVELRNSLYSSLLLQIHDELLFECPEELLEEETKQIVEIMENVVSWKVPLKVNTCTGTNWLQAHFS